MRGLNIRERERESFISSYLRLYAGFSNRNSRQLEQCAMHTDQLLIRWVGPHKGLCVIYHVICAIQQNPLKPIPRAEDCVIAVNCIGNERNPRNRLVEAL